MDQHRTNRPAVVGGSSLLVMFAVLCLTVFVLLALSTVQAQQRLSLSCAKAVEDYYRADTQAEVILAQLRDGQLPREVTRQGECYCYTCPITQTQQLAVRVRPTVQGWQVLCWQVQSTAQWEEDTLKLWDGEMGF